MSGNQSFIKLSLENRIHLDEDKNYMLGLVGFYSDDFICNINQDIEAAFQFGFGEKGCTFPLFRNQYSTEDLEKIFRESLKLTINSMTDDEKAKYNLNNFKIVTNPNLNLLIISPIDFLINKKVYNLLGFSDEKGIFKFKANEQKIGTDLPKLRPFDVIEIHSNLVEPSITNHTTDIHKHEETEILYSFFPDLLLNLKLVRNLMKCITFQLGKT